MISYLKFGPENLYSENPDFLSFKNGTSKFSFGTHWTEYSPSGQVITIEEESGQSYYVSENNAYVFPDQISYASWATPENVTDGYFDWIEVEDYAGKHKVVIFRERESEYYSAATKSLKSDWTSSTASFTYNRAFWAYQFGRSPFYYNN